MLGMVQGQSKGVGSKPSLSTVVSIGSGIRTGLVGSISQAKLEKLNEQKLCFHYREK